LDGYIDDWVAIADRRVVAHGTSMVEVVHQASRQGFDDALLVPAIPSPFVSSL
jgi:hypothetical protein